MYCKKCGYSLPSTGYLCTNCGCMMDAEQIKKQKEIIKMNFTSNKSQMVRQSFLHKDTFFQKREEVSKNYKVLFFFLLFLLFLIISLVFLVYFR